jgi:hypothetical protein
MRWWQIRKRDADLARELQSDLELEEEEQRERGLSAEEARSAARRAFGNATLIKEQTHEAWGWALFERFVQDLRLCITAEGCGFTTATSMDASPFDCAAAPNAERTTAMTGNVR